MGTTLLFDLPVEIVYAIFDSLSAIDLLAIGSTCHFFRKYACDDRLWKLFIDSRLLEPLDDPSPYGSFRALCSSGYFYPPTLTRESSLERVDLSVFRQEIRLWRWWMFYDPPHTPLGLGGMRGAFPHERDFLHRCSYGTQFRSKRYVNSELRKRKLPMMRQPMMRQLLQSFPSFCRLYRENDPAFIADFPEPSFEK